MADKKKILFWPDVYLIILLAMFFTSCGDDGSGVNSFEQTPETSLLVDDANSSSSVDVLPSSAMVDESSSSENFDEAWEVTKTIFGEDEDSIKDFWKLKMVRGVLKKQSTLFTLSEDGKTVSSACIRGRTEKSGAVTSVVTIPEARHKGYASYLTALCTNMLIDEGRIPWLVPANPGVRKMYEKLGYKAAKN